MIEKDIKKPILQVLKKAEESSQIATEARSELDEILTIEQEAEKRNISVQQWNDLLHVANAANKTKEWIDEAFSFPGDGKIKMVVIMDISNSTELTSLPDKLSVGGLTLEGCHNLTSLSRGLLVGENYSLIGAPSIGLSTSDGMPSWMIEFGALYIIDCTGLTSLPDDLIVEGNVYLSENLNEQVIKDVERLKTEGKIKGSIIFRNSAEQILLPSEEDSNITTEAHPNTKEINESEQEATIEKPCNSAKDFYEKILKYDYHPNGYPEEDEIKEALESNDEAQDILLAVKNNSNGPLMFLLEMDNLKTIMDKVTFQEALDYSDSEEGILGIIEASAINVDAAYFKKIFFHNIETFKRNMKPENFEKAITIAISQNPELALGFYTGQERAGREFSKFLDEKALCRIRESALGFLFNYAETHNGCWQIIEIKDLLQKSMHPEHFKALLEVAKLTNKICFPSGASKNERTEEWHDKVMQQINELRGILNNRKEADEGRDFLIKHCEKLRIERQNKS